MFTGERYFYEPICRHLIGEVSREWPRHIELADPDLSRNLYCRHWTVENAAGPILDDRPHTSGQFAGGNGRPHDYMRIEEIGFSRQTL